MTADQFKVCEHYSYDMIGAWCSTLYSGPFPRNDLLAMERMELFLRGSVTPIRCRFYLFPDYQFNAQEFANR